MAWQHETVSFLGPAELDQLVFYLQNASAKTINSDVYHKKFKNPGIITRSIEHNLLGWLEHLKLINKSRLCTAAKIYYLKNK